VATPPSKVDVTEHEERHVRVRSVPWQETLSRIDCLAATDLVAKSREDLAFRHREPCAEQGSQP